MSWGGWWWGGLGMPSARDGATINSSRNGTTNELVPLPLWRLFCSQRARERLLAEMIKRNALCTRCHLVCRSDELVDGVCSGGVGCSDDVDVGLLALDPLTREFDTRKLMHELWQSFASRSVREMGTPDPPAAKEGEGPW